MIASARNSSRMMSMIAGAAIGAFATCQLAIPRRVAAPVR
jgi:hypothetical protein